MARASLTGFDELEKFLGALAKPERMAIKAVDRAAPLLKDALKAEIGRATGGTGKGGRKKHHTGHLQDSIELTKAKENHLGVFAVVKPAESVDENGMRAPEKLAYLEYGVPPHINANGTQHPGTQPQPIRQRAVNSVEAQCKNIMRETIYGEVDKL